MILDRLVGFRFADRIDAAERRWDATGQWTRALRRMTVSDTYMNAHSRPNLSTPAGRAVGFAIQPFESLRQDSPFLECLVMSFAEKNGHGSVTRIDAFAGTIGEMCDDSSDVFWDGKVWAPAGA